MNGERAEGAERRRRVLSDEDLQALAETFRETHAGSRALHQEHHDFVAAWIKKEKREQERWEKVKVHVTGWAIVGMLGGIGIAVWYWVKDHLK